MLWKKESERSDSLYVDISVLGPKAIGINLPKPESNDRFEVFDLFRSNITTSTLNKNDSVALQKRMKGNELFGKGKFSDAMEMYNESLCFAEPKSPHISLAYANRSNCFLKMKRFNECLIDIELAIEAGYPENLMPKLEKRKSDCLECIEKEDKEQSCAYEPKLSYKPNEIFPCLAEVVNFQRDENGKCAVVAKVDIAVGQVIAIEKAFTTCLQMRYGSKCTICLKPEANLIPCKKCTIAMFCCDECQGDFIHEHECGVVFNDLIDNMENVRGVLKAISLFSTAEELINFVEETIKDDSDEVPANLTDVKLSYREFLKSTYNFELQSDNLGTFHVYPVYKLLLDIQEVREMFNTEHKRRFLMHLIGQNELIRRHNTVNTILVEGLYKTELGNKNKVLHSMTGAIKKHFGHSCAPNVQLITIHNKFVYYTLRPIKSGEPLRISVCVFLLETKEKRQEVLLKYRQITCKCERCDGATVSELQPKQLASDPDYSFVNEKTKTWEVKRDDLQEIIDKCVSFLTKYGRMTWCDEIGEVITAYKSIQSIQWLGGFDSWPETFSPAS